MTQPLVGRLQMNRNRIMDARSYSFGLQMLAKLISTFCLNHKQVKNVMADLSFLW
jgi:hypothetical protein